MKNPNVFLLASVLLIVMAVALVAILDKSSTKSNTSDVRARATSKSALTLVGTVASVEESKGIVQVDNVQFSNASLAGTPQNLGTMMVTAPVGFNFASVSPGIIVTIGVDAPTFQVTSHTVSALTITPGK